MCVIYDALLQNWKTAQKALFSILASHKAESSVLSNSLATLVHNTTKHGLSIHVYADDSQIYIEFDLTPQAALVANKRIEACVVYIRSWMRDNKLKLRDQPDCDCYKTGC